MVKFNDLPKNFGDFSIKSPSFSIQRNWKRGKRGLIRLILGKFDNKCGFNNLMIDLQTLLTELPPTHTNKVMQELQIAESHLQTAYKLIQQL